MFQNFGSSNGSEKPRMPALFFFQKESGVAYANSISGIFYIHRPDFGQKFIIGDLAWIIDREENQSDLFAYNLSTADFTDFIARMPGRD